MEAEPMALTILHATDFSEEADGAEAEAIRLVRATGGQLVLLHVARETMFYGDTGLRTGEIRKVYKAQVQWAEGRLAERARALGADGVPTRWIRRSGVPHEEIVAVAAREKADYIVIGTHGYGGFSRFMLGSVADKVIRTAPCPVIVVRPTSAS
jgi:nucleotide-binding universal stress UspA family protein